jgi:hypothetical protein
MLASAGAKGVTNGQFAEAGILEWRSPISVLRRMGFVIATIGHTGTVRYVLRGRMWKTILNAKQARMRSVLPTTGWHIIHTYGFSPRTICAMENAGLIRQRGGVWHWEGSK